MQFHSQIIIKKLVLKEKIFYSNILQYKSNIIGNIWKYFFLININSINNESKIILQPSMRLQEIAWRT